VTPSSLNGNISDPKISNKNNLISEICLNSERATLIKSELLSLAQSGEELLAGPSLQENSFRKNNLIKFNQKS
jgi:hypothetical protein